MNKTQLLNWIMQNIQAGDVVRIIVGRFTKNDDEPRFTKKKWVIENERGRT